MADSDPAAEYAECLIKATPLLTAIGARLAAEIPAGREADPDDGTATRPGAHPATATATDRLGAASPADSDALSWLTPRPSAGVFTSLRVTNGQTRGLADHLARLAASVRELYGKDLPARLDADLAACLATTPTGRLRITVRPVGGPLQTTIEVVPLTLTPAAAAPMPGPIPKITARSAGGAPPDPASHDHALAGQATTSQVPPSQARAPAGIALRPVTVAGGIGAHKWRDRRLLAELSARVDLTASQQLLITDETGELLETDRANVFAVIDGVLLTPPADGRLLPGTTRAAVMRARARPRDQDRAEAADPRPDRERNRGLRHQRRRHRLPVTAIDGCPATWPPGPVAAALAAALTARPPDPSGPWGPPDPNLSEPWGPPGPNVTGPVAHRHASSGPVAPRAMTAPPRVAGRPLVVLVDNYDSFTWNLAHLLSTSGARVEVVRNDEVTAAQITELGPAGVVISPGPCAPAEAGISIETVRACAAAGTPLLGICLGHQAIAAAFGAAIIRAPRPVHGQAFDVAHDGRGIFAGLPAPSWPPAITR